MNVTIIAVGLQLENERNIWSLFTSDEFLKNIMITSCLTVLANFVKNINLSKIVSLWYKLLCNVSILQFEEWSWENNMMSTIELEFELLILDYSNSKFKVTCKNVDFKCRYIRSLTEEKSSKIISNITFAMLHFLIKILASRVLWSLFLSMKTSDALQNGLF